MAATSKASTVKDVDATKFIHAYAAHLKKSGSIELPKWIDLVKTGVHRELAPHDPDWFYIRAAAIARKVYLRGGLGVNTLSHEFGGASKSGTRRSHHQRAAHGLIRNILKQFETLNLVKAAPNGGRQITSKGQKDLDLIASTVV